MEERAEEIERDKGIQEAGEEDGSEGAEVLEYRRK